MEFARADFRFVLNREPKLVEKTAPQVTLLDYIRAEGLTGAKEGCAEGECGACAVLIVRPGVKRASLQSINSCLVPLPAVAGQEIYTVESLAECGRLADVQRAMMERGGSQCGYCTPGFVVSMFAEHCRQGNGGFDADALGGNLCRCTGYRPIKEAMHSLGTFPDSALGRRLNQPAPDMSPVYFETSEGRFSRPCNITKCLELAAEYDSAQFVAGNTDLGVMTNLRDRRFAHLISLEGVPELQEFLDEPDAVEIGAALTLAAIGELWDDAPAIFREWLRLFASPLIRNRATLGGNLATASPIGDAAPMLLSLDAEVRISSLNDDRIVPLHSFFRDYRQTVLSKGEILRSVRIPRPWPSDTRFYKVAKRSVDDISTVAAGIAFRRGDAGLIRAVRLAFGGVGPTPLRALEAEEALTGTYGEERDIQRAQEVLRRTLHPIGDHRGSADYRLAMAQSLLEKFCFQLTDPVSA